MKKIAIIPVLLGSTRIPDKNLILVDGRPMVFYVAEACRDSGVFDEIYISSEHVIFEQMATTLGVGFYNRSPDRGGSACRMKNKSRQCDGERCQTHDHYLSDFISAHESDYLVQVHTTSPLLHSRTIADFTRSLEDGTYDSLFAAEERFTETLVNDKPINFSLSKKTPTQSLSPIQMITWALSGWKTAAFVESYDRDDPADAGPTFCGNVGVFPIDRIQALDADTWDDLYLIEATLQYRRQQGSPGTHKYREDTLSIEHDVAAALKRDGVAKFVSGEANQMHRNINEIKQRMGEAPWIYMLVYSGKDQIGLICQQPGEGARKHCHVTHDEWWVVLEGTFEWRLEDGHVIQAKENDVVCLPRGTVHTIVCTGDTPGIRLACGARDMDHIYVQ